MNLNLKEHLEELIQDKNKPTDKDRITALENAMADIAIMLVGVEDNGGVHQDTVLPL